MITQSDKEFINKIQKEQPAIYEHLTSLDASSKLDLKNGCHFIQNILTLISGNFQLMQLYTPTLTNNERWNQIGLDIEYLSHVMSSIGLFRYADKLEFHSVNISELMCKIEDIIPVELSPSISHKLPYDVTVNIDLSKILFVVSSLLDNIVDVDSSACIEIEANCNNGYLNLRIADTLDDFDADAKQRMFQPFNTSKQTHAGLSLATSYKVMLAHNGLLSYAPNASLGSVFTVKIPLEQ